MSYDAPSTSSFHARERPLAPRRPGDRPTARGQGFGRGRPASSVRNGTAVNQRVGVQTPREGPRTPVRSAGGRGIRQDRPAPIREVTPTVVVAAPAPVKKERKKKMREAEKLEESVTENLFGCLEIEGEEALDASVLGVNNASIVLSGSVAPCGFSYKKHFEPYARPTAGHRGALPSDLLADYSTKIQDEAKGKKQSKQKDEGKGKEKEHEKEKATSVTAASEGGAAPLSPDDEQQTSQAVAVNIFVDEASIPKVRDTIGQIVYSGKSIFFDEKDAAAGSFFIDETKVKKPENEFKIPESNADKFFAGFEPVASIEVKVTESKEKGKKPQAKAAPAKTTVAPQKPAEIPSIRRSSGKPLEPEEEEIENLASLAGQGFIPRDEFERRKTELLKSMAERQRLNQESERERKKLEAEQRRKLEEAERKYKLAKLEEQRLWEAKEKLRAHQMKVKRIAEEGLGASISFDDDLNPRTDPDAVDLDKILQCVQDADVAMQIYEYLITQGTKRRKTRKVKVGEMYDIDSSRSLEQLYNSGNTPQRRINSMADVLHVLHVSGRTSKSLVTSSQPQLLPSQVKPTRENMHYIEKIANKDPALVQGFLKQIKKERKLRLRYQQDLQAFRLAVSDNPAY